MENKSLRFYAIMALWVVLFVMLFVSNRRVDLKTDINKSTSVSVSVEDTVSLSPSVVTTRAYSAGDDTYQAFFEILLLPKVQPECPLLLPRLRSAFHHPALCRRCQPEPALHRLFRRSLSGKRKIRLPPLPRWKRGGDLPAAAGCGGLIRQKKNKRFEKFTSQGVYFLLFFCRNCFFCSVLHVWSMFRICVSSQSARPVI